jgi:arginyl-tRNA synthetase
MREKLAAAVQNACKELFNSDIAVELTRPDGQFGDFTTNIALRLAKEVSKNPHEIAETIAEKLRGHEALSEVSVAGPGFLNLKLTDDALLDYAQEPLPESLKGQVIVAEYSDPNPFKVLHAGHLYTSIVGDAIANILEAAGAEVHRVNFGGDVGLHVAKTMWAILRELGGENPDKLGTVPPEQHAEWMSERYIEGNNAYEENELIRPEVIELNKRVYQLHTDNDKESPFAHIYWTCREWSYGYFEMFYERIGTNFEKYYPESQTAPIGLSTVQEQLEKGVYEKSEGAVIFNGEKYGLHTRVFINSEGLPTYEAKDVGLIMAKWQDYHFDTSVVITGNDIVEYMKVVLKSVEQFEPDLVKATKHLTHGIVKLQGGVKMSSRKGNILRAVDVLQAAAEASGQATGNKDDTTVLAAVKYAFLKQRIGGDIIYDPKESVNVLGSSGPYLQYAHARARSILSKTSGNLGTKKPWQPDERRLLRKISEYNEVVEQATADLLPSHIATYLYELAQEFNRFYEKNRVIDDPREIIRLGLVKGYAETLKHGLELLGIPAPEHI